MKILILFVTLPWLIYCSATPGQKDVQIAQQAEMFVAKKNTAPEKASYLQIKKNIIINRARLFDQFNNVVGDSEKAGVIDSAKIYLVSTISDSLIPFWYGTPWEFYGSTETPGKGSIACGYFVSTVLHHAGFKVERVRMAQQASELIIKSLTKEKFIRRFSSTPISNFVDKIIEMGEGLYVAGLDIHTGFILKKKSKVWFIHSSYQPPLCVIKEKALESAILASSAYRVVGKISDDDELILKWLKGEKINTKTY